MIVRIINSCSFKYYIKAVGFYSMRKMSEVEDGHKWCLNYVAFETLKVIYKLTVFAELT